MYFSVPFLYVYFLCVEWGKKGDVWSKVEDEYTCCRGLEQHMPLWVCGEGLVSAAPADGQDSDWSSPITGASKDPTCHISITMNPDFNSDFCLGCLNALAVVTLCQHSFSCWRPLSSLFTPYKWTPMQELPVFTLKKHISCTKVG